jgi:cell division septation protein DedD
MNDPEIISPGDVYEEPSRGMGPLAKIFAVGAITVGMVALAGVVWFAYQQGIRSDAEDAAPVISASDDPIKREPKEPGGLNIPDQDKLVFGRLAPGQIQEPVERLLPPPEEPTDRAPSPVVKISPIDVPSPPAEAPTAARSNTAEPESVNPEPAAMVAPLPPPSPPAPVVTPPPSVVAAKPPAPPAAATPAPTAAPKPPAAVAANAWRIQLAAVSSRERALSEWERLIKQNTDLLGPLDLNVQSARLERGTFFRIQAGPLTGRAAASDLCGKLKSRNQDCLIVAP